MAKAKADDEATGGAEHTQADMVRAALSELGPRAKPQAIHDFIKEKFGREVTKGIISNYKSTMKKKGLIPGRRGPGRPPREAGGGGAGGGTVRIDDLEAVRGLVARIGADQVVRLVKVLE
ncbi:hypothetical protein J0H58_26635 [bacterium]|nr:hypothetical protein [bacterium]